MPIDGASSHIQSPALRKGILEAAQGPLRADSRALRIALVDKGRQFLVHRRPHVRRKNDTGPVAPLPKNEAASALAGRNVCGDALVVSTRSTFKGREWLYQRMRPEFTRTCRKGDLDPDSVSVGWYHRVPAATPAHCNSTTSCTLAQTRQLCNFASSWNPAGAKVLAQQTAALEGGRLQKLVKVLLASRWRRHYWPRHDSRTPSALPR